MAQTDGQISEWRHTEGEKERGGGGGRGKERERRRARDSVVHACICCVTAVKRGCRF